MNVLGIDGGGTKTLLALCDERGENIHTLELPTFALAQHGEEGVREMLSSGAARLLEEAGLPGALTSRIAAYSYGVPGLGESVEKDAAMERAIRACFGDLPGIICNDSQVAWAGSFAMRPGINVVAGTGAIAFGMDDHGRTARCGGWGYYFSDEGSGYWLGRKLMEVFCKQADGRIPERGPLYTLVHEHFATEDDFRIVELAESEYMPRRDKVASLQKVLFAAAEAGDASAIDCYRQAGREIALNVRGVRGQLLFDGEVNVSYSGGIFRVGPLVMESFAETLARDGCTIIKPVAPPWVGALMLALALLPGDPMPARERLLEEVRARCL